MPTAALRAVAATSAGTADRIAGFLQGFSIEATRPNEDELAALAKALAPCTPVYLGAVPGRPPFEQIGPAARLRALGLEPVPHLAVRSLPSRGALEDLLAQWSARAGVRRVLVVGGDRERAEGPFRAAIEAIESGLLQRHGILEIGIAGYPDGHPRLPADALERALLAKVEAAVETGLSVHIVTQFSFDPIAIANWLRRLRDLGIDHPVRIGMAGPASVAALLRFAKRCGVRADARGLARQAGLVKHLVGSSAPDGIVRTIAEAPTDRPLGRVAAHFFSFGGAGATARWAASAAAGRIALDRGEGFRVEPL